MLNDKILINDYIPFCVHVNDSIAILIHCIRCHSLYNEMY